MFKLNFCIETDDVTLMETLLRAMPALQGEEAYANANPPSTCRMFLTSILTDSKTAWFAAFVKQARSGAIEARFMQDQFVFRQDVYCISLSVVTVDSAPGWSLSVSANPTLLQILIDVIEANESSKTIITHEGSKTTTSQLRQAVTTA